MFFFFKQKTAYEMRISDWRSDVCSSDLIARWLRGSTTPIVLVANKAEGRAGEAGVYEAMALGLGDPVQLSAEHGEEIGRASCKGKSVSVRVALGGRSISKKKNYIIT